MKFLTHTNEMVSGERLQNALNEISDYYYKLAYSIKDEDNYAEHVTEKTKIDNLNYMINMANEIKAGDHLNNFTIWQKINEILTGTCVGFSGK